MGEEKNDGLRLDFDPRIRVQFAGSKITSDGGLLAYRELDETIMPRVQGQRCQAGAVRPGLQPWELSEKIRSAKGDINLEPDEYEGES